MHPTQVAAYLMRDLYKRLHRQEPKWLESVVEESRTTLVSDMQRTAPELKKLLDELDEDTRSRLLAENRSLQIWYRLYTDYQDVDVFELTGRVERPMSQLLREYGAPQ